MALRLIAELAATGRPLADASELAANAVELGFGESLEDAIARELAAAGELIGEAGPKWGVAAPLAGMVLGATRAVPDCSRRCCRRRTPTAMRGTGNGRRIPSPSGTMTATRGSAPRSRCR